MLGLMSHVTAEVPPNDAVPSSDVFFDVVLLQGLCGTLHGVLLHVLRHVGVFDHCLSVRHGCPGKPKYSREFITHGLIETDTQGN
ncbi:unnamed protein product, partial [Menidia menidia]